MNVTELANTFTYEQLASALYHKGLNDGYPKVTDKTKWREPVMANKLGHIAHEKISAGAGKDEYGSDAYDPVNEVYAEYKTKAINDRELRNLLQLPKRGGGTFAPLRVKGVYNGAYKESALEAYKDIEHYFGVFYREECVLIVKPRTEDVIRQLRENNNKRKVGATTNGNSAEVNLGEPATYEVAYRKDEFFDKYTKCMI